MAGLDPAIPLGEAGPCHMIGIAGSSPAMTAGESISSGHALDDRRPARRMITALRGSTGATAAPGVRTKLVMLFAGKLLGDHKGRTASPALNPAANSTDSTPHINGLAVHLESDGTHLFAHRAAKCRWCAIVTERSGASMGVGPAGIVDYFAT
jgi:hypothetical protein